MGHANLHRLVYFYFLDTDSDDEAGEDGEEEEEDEDFVWSGKVDCDGKFHGYGTVKFKTGDIFTGNFDHGVREHDGMIISPRQAFQ